MGLVVSHFMKPRNLKILVLGLDAAGKTTLLYRIKDGKALRSSIPTIGFNVEEIQVRGVKFTMWDVGGQDMVQTLWKYYYRNVNTLVFVVDSSDRERIAEARLALDNILVDPRMRGCIILIYANKQDIDGAMDKFEVAQQLGLTGSSLKNWRIQPSCAITGDGLLEGLEWIANEDKYLRRQNKFQKKAIRPRTR